MKKKLIRSSVFETNSSSSHSVSVADETKEFVLDTLYPDQDGIIEVCGGDFGWEWFKYNDAKMKASYAAQQFANNDDALSILKEVIIDQTGAEDVQLIGLDRGYIDHDSVGILESSKDFLRDFIFNKNSWIFGGNDNDTPDPMFYDVPEFKEGKQIVPRYKYELVVEGYDKTTKFKENPTKEELENGLYSLLQGVHLHDNGYFDDDNSIFAQMSRSRNNCYEFSTYKIPVDIENKTLFFVKDAWSEARKIWERDFGKNDWQSELGYTKCREIEQGLYSQINSPFVKTAKYSLVEIK